SLVIDIRIYHQFTFYFLYHINYKCISNLQIVFLWHKLPSKFLGAVACGQATSEGFDDVYTCISAFLRSSINHNIFQFSEWNITHCDIKKEKVRLFAPSKKTSVAPITTLLAGYCGTAAQEEHKMARKSALYLNENQTNKNEAGTTETIGNNPRISSIGKLIQAKITDILGHRETWDALHVRYIWDISVELSVNITTLPIRFLTSQKKYRITCTF
ncbi:hypothetical protein ACJX0J_013530, partial [Zea mays]